MVMPATDVEVTGTCTRRARRAVLSLIRSWLEAAVVEPPVTPGGSKRITRPKAGTPQGGVISPLLANLYLHWFDKVFHRPNGLVWSAHRVGELRSARGQYVASFGSSPTRLLYS